MNIDNSSLFAIGLVGIMAGMSVGLIGWQLSHAAAKVPAQDRTYLDVPPLQFRFIWWPIQWIAYYLRPLMSNAYHQRLLARLRLAGLDFCLTPEQLIAQRLIFAGLFGAFFWWVADSFSLSNTGWVVAAGFWLGYLLMEVWFRDRIALRRKQVLKTLPFFLDLVTLCVEAGLNVTGAFQQAIAKGPVGPLREEFSRVLRDIRAGRPRIDALRTFADRLNEPGVTNFVTALIQAESMGVSLGPILRAQAEQRRRERFSRAEKAAMEAPVKLLFPLIFFIFPCVFIILLFPIAVRFLLMGL